MTKHNTKSNPKPLLTPQEAALLRVLQQNRGQTMPRGELLALAWGYPADAHTRTLDMHIRKLRKKLPPEVLGGQIQTVFRVGYRLAG